MGDKRRDKLLEMRTPVIEKCDGCDKIEDVKGKRLCKTYIFPDKKWKLGNCPVATHISTIIQEEQQGKKRIGQQKRGRRKIIKWKW